MERKYDVLVIGAGIVGCAATAELATRGLSVALLEQYDLHHAQGSSHGHARIFRLAYEDPLYVDLARRARPLWLELAGEFGQNLLEPGGAVDIGPTQELAKIEAALTVEGVEFERRTSWGEDSNDEMLLIPEGREVLYQADGGTLWARRCLQALMARALRAGADVLRETPVRRLAVNRSHTKVITTAETYLVDTVVVAAGGWTKPLLEPLDIVVPIRVTREHVAFYQHQAACRRLPFIWHSAHGQPELYGLSNLEDDTVKIGYHIAGSVVTAGGETQPEAREVQRINSFVRKYGSSLSTPPIHAETCLYANSPDDDFIIDRVGPIVIAAGFGGHGFKFGPMTGKLVADVVQGDAINPRFSLTRFSAAPVDA